MSLRVDLEITKECLGRLRDAGGSLTVYKFLRLTTDREDLASPRVTDHVYVWEGGWNRAEGELPSPLTDGTIVYGGGFHVFIDEPNVWDGYVQMVVVPFLAFERDFVCAGHHERADEIHAIFRRLYLAVGDHELARKELLERPQPPEDESLAQAQQFYAAVSKALGMNVKTKLYRLEPDDVAYQRWVVENTDAGWLRRALVEVEPRDSTKPSRVWLQHRQRNRPVRVVELASVLREARIPSSPDAA